MIKAIINGVFSLVLSIIDVVLVPIDATIESSLPGISEVLNYIGQFFNYILGFIPFIFSWFNLPSWLVDFTIAYYVFKLTVPLIVHTIKLAVSWFRSIKL